MSMRKHLQGVLFDLDGTLIDTAPGLAKTVNTLLEQHGRAPRPFADLKNRVGKGARALIQFAFDLNDDAPELDGLHQAFLPCYDTHLLAGSQPYEGVMPLIDKLEDRSLPWGIVTNKTTRFALPLLTALGLADRATCIVCRDTLDVYKPDPAPLLHASKLLKCAPAHCLYVGDTQVDVIAAQAAGMPVITALYGYILPEEQPELWQADGYIETPDALLAWMD